MAIAATISAMRRLQAGLHLEGLRRLLRKRAAVARQRLAAVAVLRVPEEQAEDLRDIILVDAEVHEAPGILVADRLVLGAAQPELAGEALQVAQPPRAEPGVLADGVHHRVGRQRLVAAL